MILADTPAIAMLLFFVLENILSLVKVIVKSHSKIYQTPIVFLEPNSPILWDLF